MSWKAEENQFNSAIDLFYKKVQNGAHKNLFQCKSLIKQYLFNKGFRKSLKIKILFKCIAYIMYKSAIEHMAIKLGKLL